MGLWDRIQSVSSGIGGAAAAPFGLVGDIVTSPWNDDEEFNGILNTLYARTVTRGADFFENIFGPNEGVGAIVGGLPNTGIRDPGRAIIGTSGSNDEMGSGILGGFERAGRELIREPLATFMLTGSLVDSPTWRRENNISGAGEIWDAGTWTALLDGNTWREAGRYSEDISIGQSISLAAGTQDIMDEEEVREYVGTSAYQMSSGVIDAYFRLFMEPDYFLGEAVGASRIARGSQMRVGDRSIGMGSFRASVNPQLGTTPGFRHLSRTRAGTAAQAVLDNVYSRLPEFLRTDVYGPADVSRLAQTEAFTMRQRANMLERYARRDPNPDVLLEQAETLRFQADQVAEGTMRSNFADIAEEALTRDREAFFNAPQRRGFLAGFTQLPTFKAFDQELDSLLDGRHAQEALDEIAVLRQERADLFDVDGIPVDDTVRSLDRDIASLQGTLDDSIHLRAGLIRDRFFPNHQQGDVMSYALARAKDVGERESVMRVFLGDRTALADLLDRNYALARDLEDMSRESSTIKRAPVYASADELAENEPFDSPLIDDAFNNPDRVERLGEEMDAVIDETRRNQRLMAASSALDYKDLRFGRGRQARSRIKGSSLYQTSPFGRAVRVFTDMNPHQLVAVGDDAMADGQLGRMMNQAGGTWSNNEIARARGELMEAPMDQRVTIFQRYQENTERRILENAGLDAEDIEAVLAHANRGRSSAMEQIAKSQYDSQGRALIRVSDDSGEMIEYPMRTTELASVLPVTNMRRLRREAERFSRLKYGEEWRDILKDPARRAEMDGIWNARRAARATSGIVGDKLRYAMGGSSDLLDNIMSVWKVSVLLRPAWTFRVVLMDEMMRRIVKFGALNALAGSAKGFNDFGASLRADPKWNRWLGLDAERSTRRGLISAGAAAGGFAVAGPVGAAVAGTAGWRLLRRMGEMERRGVGNGMISGLRVQAAFGSTPGDVSELWRNQVSAQQALNEFVAPLEGGLLHQFRRDANSYRTWDWPSSSGALNDRTRAVYKSEWGRLMQRHFTQDEATLVLMRGGSADDLFEWLTGTAEGRLHMARLPGRRGLEREYADNLTAQVDDYTFNQEVRDALLAVPNDAGPSAFSSVLDQIPEEFRAPIHGADVEQVMGRAPWQRSLSTVVEEGFKLFGAMPTDALARNPTFMAFYEADVARRLSAIPQELTTSAGRQIKVPESYIRTQEDAARRFALGETRQLLYDLAEQSRFAEATRILMPFYPAWQEVLTRWAGLIYEKPQTIPLVQSIWEAPESAGLTYKDDEGNEFVQFRIPEFARSLINSGAFASAVDSQGYVRFDQNGVNMVAQGTPGFGPFVQYAVSNAVRERPELEESVRFILPFGPTRGLDPFIAPNLRRVQSINQEAENRAWANARNRILLTQLAQMQGGERPMIDFDDPVAVDEWIGSVNDEARAFASLRLVVGAFAPVQPIFDSPYQPYIDIYRALQDNDSERAASLGAEMGLDEATVAQLGSFQDQYGSRADNLFLDLFGSEFFTVTQSFTESNNGVPPTLAGHEAEQEFHDLIRRFPDWGGTIAGFTGGSSVEFSRAVYDAQLTESLGPGSDTTQRESYSAEELVAQPQVSEGWARYSRIMDQIEMMRVENGYANLNVAEAEWLREVKQGAVLGLASEYPLWYEEFQVTDRGRWSNTIEGAWALTEDERLMGRDDIRGLADYLEIREQTLAELVVRRNQGGSGTIDSIANQDLRDAFDTAVADIVEQNLAFADLYYRRLSNDPLDVETFGMGPAMDEAA